MASSDLREELDCSICLNIYTDPVMLKCGHNFCQDCIDRVFDSQGKSGDYFCPQCRKEFQERPSPHRNITLRNITQRFLSSPPPEPEKSGIFCTYCIHSSVPAVKSCLLCEASLCDDHLRVHSKAPEHVICVPTSTPENRKCPVHKKILEYYCTEDSTCICISCSLSGEHRRHQVETLQEAFIKKKKKLINNLQNVITKREKTEERVRSLQEHRGKVQGKVDGIEKRVLDLFRDLRKHLEDLEKKILDEISRQAEGVLSPVNDLIQELELKTEDLSRKMRHIEELCAMTDTLTVLQEPDSGDLCGKDRDNKYRKRHEKLLCDGGDLDVTAVSHTLRQCLYVVISGAIGGIHIQKADILLDEDTANNGVCISSHKKTVSRSGRSQNRPNSSERFEEYPQVLGSQSFSLGRHYWEVDVQKSNNWKIGMSYDRIDRGGDDSLIGFNDVSWGLSRVGKKYSFIHDTDQTELPDNILGNKVRVYLDYEAGQISFYMCDPLRHLHTFTATFTEPLYAVLGVWHSSISLC